MNHSTFLPERHRWKAVAKKKKNKGLRPLGLCDVKDHTFS
jgi:hypothetical protein